MKKTVEHFANFSVGDAREAYNLGPDAQDWTVEAAQRDLKTTGLDDKRIIPLTYRPFDDRYTHYTGNSRGFHCRARGEVMRHLSQPKEFPNIGLVTSRLTKGEQFAHAQMTDKIVEVICMSPKTSNNGFIFPLWLLPKQVKSNESLQSQLHPNLAADFLAALALVLNSKIIEPHGLPENVTSEQVPGVRKMAQRPQRTRVDV